MRVVLFCYLPGVSVGCIILFGCEFLNMWSLLFGVFAVGTVGKANNKGLLCGCVFPVGRGRMIIALGCYLVVLGG